MRVRGSGDRVLATVLFTDIVGSTERAAELGDRRWRDLVARHHAVVRAQLKRHHGREIDTAGDGFFAAFDRPAQAIECALAIIQNLAPLRLAIRAGVHVGELETSRGKLGGIAVHTAARVVAAARPSEILVTGTVRDLAAGSDLEFEDRGVSTLKGVPGEWRLFAVVARASEPSVPDALPAERTGAVGRRRAGWALLGAIVGVGLLAVAAVVAVPRLWPPPVLPTMNTVARIGEAGTGFDLVVPVGLGPSGLASGAGAVWAINFDDETLTEISAVDGTAARGRSVGGAPTGITFGADSVWVTTGFGLRSGEAGDVVRYSPELGDITSRVDVGGGAPDAVAFGEGALWVADRLGNMVLKVNPATEAVEAEVAVARSPTAIAVGLGSVWVASGLDGVLQRLDPVTLDEQARIPVDGGTAVAIGGNAAWITSETTDTVTRFTTGPTRFEEIGDAPRGVAVTSTGVWIALGGAGEVVRLDPTTGDVVSRLVVDGFPDALTSEEDGRVWVATRSP